MEIIQKQTDEEIKKIEATSNVKIALKSPCKSRGLLMRLFQGGKSTHLFKLKGRLSNILQNLPCKHSKGFRLPK